MLSDLHNSQYSRMGRNSLRQPGVAATADAHIARISDWKAMLRLSAAAELSKNSSSAKMKAVSIFQPAAQRLSEMQ